MLIQKRTMQQGLMLIAVMGLGVMPMLAGSAAVGSIAGSRNATLSGEALVPNTTVFSGDELQVKDGVAVVALDAGNRMVFGRETEASFLREAQDVTVLLRRGNVSMYHPGVSESVAVKAGGVRVSPAAGYKTLGEVAMLDGRLVVTAKEGKLQVERQGRTEEVLEGKTVTMPVTAAAPAPAPRDGNAHITTATTLGVLAVGAGTAAAVLAGLGLSRANDAKAAANAATTAGNNATTAANAATDAANAAAAAANAAGCAENIENANENPGTPSPYTPPAGFSCP